MGEWTSMKELCFAGVAIPRSASSPILSSLEAWQHVPHVGAIVDALEAIWRSAGRDGYDEAAARTGALRYDADRVAAECWAPLLECFAEDIGPRAARPSPAPFWEWDRGDGVGVRR